MTKWVNIGYYMFAGLVLALGLFLVLLQTAIIPGFTVKIVQSGSMEPAISTGSVIVVRALSSYQVGDIITFNSTPRNDTPTTHRIVATELRAGELSFTTKGDANAESDVEAVATSQIVGKVIFHIPFLGYLLDFARQPLGFVLLILVPAAFIVFEEGGNVWRQLRTRKPEIT